MTTLRFAMLARKEMVINKGMRVGYARVSTAGQKLDLQLERLADCNRVFHEKNPPGGFAGQYLWQAGISQKSCSTGKTRLNRQAKR